MLRSTCPIILMILLYASGLNGKRFFDNDDFDLEFWSPIDYTSSYYRQYTGRLYEDPVDCRIYYKYQGNYGDLVYQKCDSGTYFDETSQSCSYEKPLNCKTSWISRSQAIPQVPSTTPEPEIFAITPVPNIQSLCHDQPNGFTYQLPTNCRSYAVCWQGKSHDGECPKGFSYNGESSVCDISNNYRCESDHFCPPTGIHSFRKIGSCSEYNFCFAGIHMTKKCVDGLQFDALLNRCNVPNVALCYECPVEDNATSIVTFPGRRCHKYYMCQNAEVMEFECAPGLQWNQEKQQCDLSDNVNCKNRP